MKYRYSKFTGGDLDELAMTVTHVHHAEVAKDAEIDRSFLCELAALGVKYVRDRRWYL